MEHTKHPDAVTYTNEEEHAKDHHSTKDESRIGSILGKILKSLSISKNIIILILSGIFVTLVIADVIVFVLPRSKESPPVVLVPTPLPTKQLPSSTSVTKLSGTITPTRVQTPTPSPTKGPTATPTKTPTPTNTPSPTVTPKPPTFSDATYGVLESATCTSITGWAYDPAHPNEEVTMWLYADGGTYGGIFSGNVNTTIVRSDINTNKGISGNHGFSFSVIAPLKDGKEHSLYVYVEGKDGVRYQVGNTPHYLTCSQ